MNRSGSPCCILQHIVRVLSVHAESSSPRRLFVMPSPPRHAPCSSSQYSRPSCTCAAPLHASPSHSLTSSRTETRLEPRCARESFLSFPPASLLTNSVSCRAFYPKQKRGKRHRFPRFSTRLGVESGSLPLPHFKPKLRGLHDQRTEVRHPDVVPLTPRRQRGVALA